MTALGARMTDLEALMWRLGERDPRFRPTMSLLVVVDGNVDRPALRDRLDALAAAVPALRHRVGAGGLPVASPRWEPDPLFSVERHVHAARPRGAGPADPLHVAEDVLRSPFPDDRPPWRVVLVPGRADTLVLHLHHSYTDGLGGVRLLGHLFDPGPDGGCGSPSQPAPAERSPVAADLEAELDRAARLMGRAGPWAVRTLVEAATRPEPVLGAARAAGRAVVTQLGAARGPASPVMGARSADVQLAHLDLSLDAMRGVGRRLDATVNDVFLAGLLEGLARYHEKCAVLPPSLRLGIPISTRDGEEQIGLHNHLHGALLRGPLGPLDFDERTRLVHEMVGQARVQPWMGLVDDLAALGARTPGFVSLVASALGSLDVLASNVVGPPSPLQLLGLDVTRLVPVGPRTGAAVNATLISYAGTAHLGLNMDPAAVAGPAVLVDCLRSAYDEALSG